MLSETRSEKLGQLDHSKDSKRARKGKMKYKRALMKYTKGRGMC